MSVTEHTITDLVKSLENNENRFNCAGLSGSEKAYLLYRLYRTLKRPVLALCPKAKEAEALEEDLRFFVGETNTSIISFPSYDILPFKPLSYRSETSCSRIEAITFVLQQSALQLQQQVPLYLSNHFSIAAVTSVLQRSLLHCSNHRCTTAITRVLQHSPLYCINHLCTTVSTAVLPQVSVHCSNYLCEQLLVQRYLL